jgi:two-component system, chemotaxis family, protein-glutamate methylesterase/glutaminase
MTSTPTKVLIVDDQPSVQNLIRHALAKDPEIEVVGVAGDAYQARDLIKRLNPDVITLDIEMPRMSGLDFLERLMRLRPMPVIMFSSLTQKGSEQAVKALSLGAVDVLSKPLEGFTTDILHKLTQSVKNARHGQSAKGSGVVGPVIKGAPEQVSMARWNGKIVLMGASTGGVAAVEAVLTRMPLDCPPIVISQHMPETFLKSFAGRLNDLLPQRVQLGRHGTSLDQGNIYLSPGGLAHTGVRRNGRLFEVTAIEAPKRNGHIPSVDELFYSGVDIAENITAVLLTGIGKDGAEGMRELKQRGAYCIGQDEASCVVYGMPRAAADMGILDQQLPLQDIARAICASCETRRA